jgi:hypothetical protein
MLASIFIVKSGSLSNTEQRERREQCERSGRHRKPPTVAMNTVPNISIDVKSLLRRKNYNESLDNT